MSWKQLYTTEYDDLTSDASSAAAIRTRKANYRTKKSRRQILGEIVDSDRIETGLKISYTPARFEAEWLLNSLRPFFERGLIEDVLAQVKGGKEANVYLCKAAPATGLHLLAAKVYRPRQFRNLSNDAMYREGREILGGNGVIKQRDDSREMRAMKKKTAFGAELLHGSWLNHEYSTLEKLHRLGAAVPQPIAAAENAMLMHYIGDLGQPAPALHGIQLPVNEVHPLFAETVRNIELMLSQGLIHGDLSAFNILYWHGQITLIDFPQVTVAQKNSNAYKILRRDVQRVCEYFASQGFSINPHAIAEQLWRKHIRLPLE
jgi:RIO kinase 1